MEQWVFVCTFVLFKFLSGVKTKVSGDSKRNDSHGHLKHCVCVLFMLVCAFFLQVSAIEQDIIEVDPDTKEMLKVLVSSTVLILYMYSLTAVAA